MSFYSSHINSATSNTPATQPILGRESEMAPNNNGGVSFVIDDWMYLDRFIMIGSAKGNNAKDAYSLTNTAIAKVVALIKQDGARAINAAVTYSVSGRAPSNDPAIVVVALAASVGSPIVQNLAYDAMLQVCRIGTHLFTFISVLNSLGKWNAAAKRGVAKWYTSRPIDRLAVQLLKYQQRNGWSHRDVLRKTHIKPADQGMNDLLFWVTSQKGTRDGIVLPTLVNDFMRLQTSDSSSDAIAIIEQNRDISWEMIPTQFLTKPDVIASLLPNMGMTALIRQLGKFSNLGLDKPFSETFKMIQAKLNDEQQIKKGRIHPITLLTALKAYGQGSSTGSLTWNVNQQIKASLNAAFYKSFTFLEDTGANILLGVDCSGSMFSMTVDRNNLLTAAEVAGVMSLAIAKSHANHMIGGFSRTFKPLAINPNMDLETCMKVIRNFDWSSTNVSSVMEYAVKEKLPVDSFVIITDNDVNSGSQPTQALAKFRKAMSKPAASSIVIATSMSEFSVADPKDPLQFDIAGFDSSAPALVSELARFSLARS